MMVSVGDSSVLWRKIGLVEMGDEKIEMVHVRLMK